MTKEKIVHDGREEISVAFGPQSFTKAENELFSEKINPARARSFWGEVGKAAIEIGKAVATRPTRARARIGAYDILGVGVEENKVPSYRNALTTTYTKVGNDYLQKITGEFGKFVYGANDNGEIYVNRNLDIADEKATNLHEYAHTDKPHAGEAVVEATGRAYAEYIAENDYSGQIRELARTALAGFEKAEGKFFQRFSYN